MSGPELTVRAAPWLQRVDPEQIDRVGQPAPEVP